MKKEIMEQWVAALRSGYYAQTKNKLKHNDGYCCLGVLCDISKQGQWADGGMFLDTHQNSSDTTLPSQVMIWAGLQDDSGLFPKKIQVFYEKIDGKAVVIDSDEEFDHFSIANTLAEMNDAGFTFDQIADFIEKNWKYL